MCVWPWENGCVWARGKGPVSWYLTLIHLKSKKTSVKLFPYQCSLFKEMTPPNPSVAWLKHLGFILWILSNSIIAGLSSKRIPSLTISIHLQCTIIPRFYNPYPERLQKPLNFSAPSPAPLQSMLYTAAILYFKCRSDHFIPPGTSHSKMYSLHSIAHKTLHDLAPRHWPLSILSLVPSD